MTKFFKYIIVSSTIFTLTLTACGTGETPDTADTTAPEVSVLTPAEAAAQDTAAALREQSQAVITAAQAQSERLEMAGERIVEATERNTERLTSNGEMDAEAAAQLKTLAEEKAADYRKTAQEVMERATNKAKAMEEAGKAIVNDTKSDTPN